MDKSNKKRLVYSLVPWLLFVFVMASAYYLNYLYDLNYTVFGVYPRDASGLKGILFSPFIHGSLEHLGNNSLPILILGTALFYFYGKLGIKVIFVLYFLSGFLVWLSARESFHIGSSGIVYALAGFIFMSGILRREKSLIALSLLVAFLYGSLIWGIFPIKEHISWESHLWGGISGFVIAWYYRNEGPQRKPFEWELEEEEDELEDAHWKQDHTRQEEISSQLRKKYPDKRIVIHYDYKDKQEDKT